MLFFDIESLLRDFRFDVAQARRGGLVVVISPNCHPDGEPGTPKNQVSVFKSAIEWTGKDHGPFSGHLVLALDGRVFERDGDELCGRCEARR